MATDSIMGLFQDPQQYQQAQLQQQMKQNYDIAQMTPEQQVTGGLRTAGYQLGGAIGGLMGAEDPQMKLMGLRKQLAQGKDLTSSAGWAAYAQELQANNDLEGAAKAAQKATEIQSGAELKQAKLAQAKDIQTQKDQAALERLQERIAADIQRAKERGESEERIAKMQIEGRRELKTLVAGMGGGLTDLKKQILEAKLETEKEKKASAVEATTGRLENLIDSTANVMTTIEKAKGQVSGTTAGMGGRLLGWTTSATDLEETLNTVKANLGFDRLQQMRNESKTGGALGQVAVKELERLEAARASLNRAQSPEQLKSNLDNVYQAYSNWRTAATRALEEKKKLAASPNAAPTSKLTFEQKVQRTMADPANAGKTRAQVEASLRAAGHN